jgi:hypothetical protein
VLFGGKNEAEIEPEKMPTCSRTLNRKDVRKDVEHSGADERLEDWLVNGY